MIKRTQRKYKVIAIKTNEVIFIGTVQEVSEYLGCFYNTVYIYAENYLTYKNKYMFVDTLENDNIKDGYKVCIKCGTEKPIDKFVKNRHTCKSCYNKYRKELKYKNKKHAHE